MSNNYRPDSQDGFTQADRDYHAMREREDLRAMQADHDEVDPSGGYRCDESEIEDEYHSLVDCYSSVDFCHGWDGE